MNQPTATTKPQPQTLISEAREMVSEARALATTAEADARNSPGEANQYIAKVATNHLANCTELFNRIITKYS